MNESIEFKTPQENTFLTEKDREVMRAGMEKLKQFFNETPPDKLPTVIVFFDISARPLLYFLKPLIEQVYFQKGVSLPKYRFVSSFSRIEKYRDLAEAHSALKQELQELESQEGASTDEELNRQIDDIRNAINDIEIKAEDSSQPSLSPEEVQEESNIFSERLNVIFSLSTNGAVLFIDDFINDGGTLKNLNNAIDELLMWENSKDQQSSRISPDLITMFTFYAEGREKYGNKEERLSSKIKVIEGMSGEDYTGFKYRDTYSFLPSKVMRYQKEKEAIIGNRKSFASVDGGVRAENADPQKMSQLRQIMRTLGEQALNDLNNK